MVTNKPKDALAALIARIKDAHPLWESDMTPEERELLAPFDFDPVLDSTRYVTSGGVRYTVQRAPEVDGEPGYRVTYEEPAPPEDTTRTFDIELSRAALGSAGVVGAEVDENGGLRLTVLTERHAELDEAYEAFIDEAAKVFDEDEVRRLSEAMATETLRIYATRVVSKALVAARKEAVASEAAS